MKHLTIILFLIITSSLQSQNIYKSSLISKSTNDIVKKIEVINELMSSAVYYEGVKPRQWDNFIDLQKTANKNELIELTNYPNGVVRCYAFWALSYDQSIDLFPILLKNINDYEIVKTQFGCLGGRVMVADFLIEIVTPNYIDLESKKFDDKQFDTLDSLLIYSNSKLNAKSVAISRAKTLDSSYSKMRELVINDKDQDALVKLAKYKNVADIALILGNRSESKLEEKGFYYTYKAIQEFPHADFLPLLQQNLLLSLDNTHYSHEWKELYKAIALYKNENSVELLKIPFTQTKHDDIKKYHINYIYNAIQVNKDKIYDSILWKLWEDEQRITSDIYYYLKEKDSLKAFELTKKSMLQFPNVYIASIGLNPSDIESLDDMSIIMLDEILKKDFELGIEIIQKNIKSSKVGTFSIFTNKIIGLKNPKLIEPLFERLEIESNPYVYLEIAKVLISYQDDNIIKRIHDTRKTNSNLKEDWGGKELTKLLKHCK